jgi:hypothetical protein
VLRVLGFPPLLLDLEAVQDTDHVIAVYRVRGGQGRYREVSAAPRTGASLGEGAGRRGGADPPQRSERVPLVETSRALRRAGIV